VQAILLVEESPDPLYQKYILVRDINDRGNGSGIKKIGLAGGKVEKHETPRSAILREILEEAGLSFREHFSFLRPFGVYLKTRQPGEINCNSLYCVKVNRLPNELKTNDPDEVSEVLIMNLTEIIQAYERGEVHEGSIRLILLHILGETEGVLNHAVEYMGKRL
jgi:8-oxo-dGTP pyrophosphatase MutT (NUDIX family)